MLMSPAEEVRDLRKGRKDRAEENRQLEERDNRLWDFSPFVDRVKNWNLLGEKHKFCPHWKMQVRTQQLAGRLALLA